MFLHQVTAQPPGRSPMSILGPGHLVPEAEGRISGSGPQPPQAALLPRRRLTGPLQLLSPPGGTEGRGEAPSPSCTGHLDAPLALEEDRKGAPLVCERWACSHPAAGLEVTLSAPVLPPGLWEVCPEPAAPRRSSSRGPHSCPRAPARGLGWPRTEGTELHTVSSPGTGSSK